MKSLTGPCFTEAPLAAAQLGLFSAPAVRALFMGRTDAADAALHMRRAAHEGESALLSREPR